MPWRDTAVEELESTLATRAFTRLPERWQLVLWRTEVEQQSPAEVAALLGLTPNGVSALAYRAREGLRQAYLQEHLVRASTPARCQRGASADAGCSSRTTDRTRHGATLDQLGAWARDGLSPGNGPGWMPTWRSAWTAGCWQRSSADVTGGLCREPLPRTAGTGGTGAGSA